MGIMLLTAGAGEAAFDLSTIMSSAVTSIQNSIMLTLGVVVPALVAVYASVIAVKFGLRWLKKLGGA